MAATTTFIMATRLTPEAAQSPQNLEELERKAEMLIKTQCPEVQWLGNYSILGPYDYIDIFTAPDAETAMKVAAIVRTFGHAYTEVWTATKWERFKEILRAIPPHVTPQAPERELRQ